MMTSDAKRALAKTIRELREKIILPDLREATERAYQLAIEALPASGFVVFGRSASATVAVCNPQPSREAERSPTDDDANRSGSIAEKAEAHRDDILALCAACKGNLVRVHEELAARGIVTLSYPALTSLAGPALISCRGVPGQSLGGV
jgi:hypothetical protein